MKESFFISAVVAQIEAMERGESDDGVMNAIEEASVRSLRECLDILRAKFPATSGQDSGQEVNGELNGAAVGGEYDFLWKWERLGIGMRDLGFEVGGNSMKVQT